MAALEEGISEVPIEKSLTGLVSVISSQACLNVYGDGTSYGAQGALKLGVCYRQVEIRDEDWCNPF